MGITFPHPVWSISSYQQTMAEVVFGLAALASLAYCVYVARRDRKIWPLAVFGGAALTITYEPFNNLLGHCAYPLIGQHTAIDFLGQRIPLYILFVYAFYFAVPVVWLMQRFEAGITARQLAKYFGVAIVLCAAFEPFFVSQQWWKYTGQQPLSLTGLPMWWWFANPMCVFAEAAFLHLLRRHVIKRDLETAVFVLLGPLSVFAFHGSAAVPLYIGINAHSMTYAVIGSLGSIALSLIYMLIVSRAVTVSAAAAVPAAAWAAPAALPALPALPAVPAAAWAAPAALPALPALPAPAVRAAPAAAPAPAAPALAGVLAPEPTRVPAPSPRPAAPVGA